MTDGFGTALFLFVILPALLVGAGIALLIKWLA